MEKIRELNTSSEGSNVQREDHEESLLKLLEAIKPERLESTSHTKYVKFLKESIGTCLLYDGSFLLLLVQAIKECRQPCYKREVLIEALDLIIFSDDILFTNILSQPYQKSSINVPWKELSNTIVSLPDLIANCNSLRKFTRFKQEEFYTHLLTTLGNSLDLKTVTTPEKDLFYAQIIGRIAISGFSQLVWVLFTSRTLQGGREGFKTNATRILAVPLYQDDQVAKHFEIFIEPLYVSIFFNLTPTSFSGELIKSILGDKINSHESLNYIICNKSILQKNYTQSRRRQSIILFNIFSYLSCLVKDQQKNGQSLNEQEKKNKISCLIGTLLEVAESWSNGTRILLRSYEQNRYITCALIIAFRHALEHDKEGLSEVAEKVHLMIVRGFPIYLNRASKELRNLAMCLGEILLPKLHKLIDEYLGRDKSRESLDLDFEIQWDESCLNMKDLFELEVEKLFNCPEVYGGKSGENPNLIMGSLTPVNVDSRKPSDDKSNVTSNCQQQLKQATAVLADKVQAEEGEEDDDDDLIPYKLEDSCDSDNSDVGEDCMSVPIYLRDCINGLAGNNKPRYVRICLIKAGELIRQHLEQEAMKDKNALVSLPLTRASRQEAANHLLSTEHNRSVKAEVNDEIRDIALEMAQVLLYLDDQFQIENFDAHRIKAMSFLAAAAPDLVVKYLLDKFNESCGSTRQQLDILQVLVASAQHLSGSEMDGLGLSRDIGSSGDGAVSAPSGGSKSCQIARKSVAKIGGATINKFVRYAPLFFYGIVHRLKANLDNSSLPNTIVSAVKSLEDSTTSTAAKGETLIRRVLAGLANTKSQLGSLEQAGGGFCSLAAISSIASSSGAPFSRVVVEETKDYEGDNKGAPEQQRRVKEEEEEDKRDKDSKYAAKDSRQRDESAMNEGAKLSHEPEDQESARQSGRRQIGELSRRGDDTTGAHCDDQIDDSYLLSRILFSVSLIIKCLHQQPIICKLSNDLLDILAAYRNHPDPGVRASIVACLTAIRLCTPKVYFQEYLCDKTMCLI